MSLRPLKQSPVVQHKLQSTAPKSKTLTEKLLPGLLEHPLAHVGVRFQTTKRTPSVAGPFTVVDKRTVPTSLKKVFEDVQILSRNPALREKVFGSSERLGEWSTEVANRPLNLRAKDDGQDYLFVEVSADVFTLENGEQRVVYRTSNRPGNVECEYDYLTELVDKFKAEGHRVVGFDSVGSRRLNLLPSVDDKGHFKKELGRLLKAHPELSLDQWRRYTTMELEPVTHRVDLKDWVTERPAPKTRDTFEPAPKRPARAG